MIIRKHLRTFLLNTVACLTGYYKAIISNSSMCTQCPIYSNTTQRASTSLADCECLLSMGNAEITTCYGKYYILRVCV